MDALTSLRFFGALAVFAYHIRLVIDLPHNHLTLLLYKGYMGVDFFFIPSGLIGVWGETDQKLHVRAQLRQAGQDCHTSLTSRNTGFSRQSGLAQTYCA